jgi:hypothetical protein
VSELVPKSTEKSEMLLEDYDPLVISCSNNFSMNKSIETLTKNVSVGKINQKSSKIELTTDAHVLNFSKFLKKKNRYRSNLRVDKSLPYNVDLHYKDVIFEKKPSESSLRSISERENVRQKKLRGRKNTRPNGIGRKEYFFQSQDEHIKNNRSLFRLKGSLKYEDIYNSQKKLAKDASSGRITLERSTILDSPAYKQDPKNMLKYYNKSVKQTLTKNHNKKAQDFLRIFNMSEKVPPLVKEKSIDKIFYQIDEHMEKYSPRESSRNNVKKDTKNLVLPSLSKRTGVFEVIKSVDIKHSNQRDKSLNRIKKLTSKQHTKNIKITSLKASPLGNKIGKRSISRKLEGLVNRGSHNMSTQHEVKRESANASIAMLNNNQDRLREHLRKLAKLSKKTYDEHKL